MQNWEDTYTFESRFNSDYSVEARKIIRALSEDSRTSIAELSKNSRLSRKTVTKKLKEIEDKFGVKYTLELDERAIGATNPHLIMLKFEEKPEEKELVRILESSYIPQTAAWTNGNYDMFIYANAISSSDYAHWDRGMRIALSKYGVSWHPSQIVHRQLGFFPLRNEILDKLNLGKHKDLIKLLNDDSRQSFQSLSDKLNANFSTTSYNFSKLTKMNLIKRFTLTLNPIEKVSFMSFFSTYEFSEGYEQVAAMTRKVFFSDDKETVSSRYLMCAPLIGNYDFFVLGAFDNSETAYKKCVKIHRDMFEKYDIKIQYATVSKLLFGRLPIRSLDTQKVYDTIKWTPIGSD